MLVLIQIFYFVFSIPCPRQWGLGKLGKAISNGGPTLSPNILANFNSLIGQYTSWFNGLHASYV